MTNNHSETTALGVQVQEVDELFASARAALASGSDNAIFAIGGMMKRLAADSEDAAATPITSSRTEHEVLEVTEGHRVTLTYNLYWTPYRPTPMRERGGWEEWTLLFCSLEKLSPLEMWPRTGGPIPDRRFSKTQTDPEQEEEREILERV
ncbi:hypothetical protein LZ32DRAFT_655161 [Colletotrichum eremochloae]|nr:hypothetical protein LZ32DRAFT_655161 [Colletotrichum eremochloae]